MYTDVHSKPHELIAGEWRVSKVAGLGCVNVNKIWDAMVTEDANTESSTLNSEWHYSSNFILGGR